MDDMVITGHGGGGRGPGTWKAQHISLLTSKPHFCLSKCTDPHVPRTPALSEQPRTLKPKLKVARVYTNRNGLSEIIRDHQRGWDK